MHGMAGRSTIAGTATSKVIMANRCATIEITGKLFHWTMATIVTSIHVKLAVQTAPLQTAPLKDSGEYVGRPQ